VSSLEDIPSPLTAIDDDSDINSNLCNSPAPPSSLIYIIDTKFNPALLRNTKVDYSGSDDRYKFTQKERKFASRAQEPSSLEELSQQA
jgi:hypothetical protein